MKWDYWDRTLDVIEITRKEGRSMVMYLKVVSDKAIRPELVEKAIGMENIIVREVTFETTIGRVETENARLRADLAEVVKALEYFFNAYKMVIAFMNQLNMNYDQGIHYRHTEALLIRLQAQTIPNDEPLKFGESGKDTEFEIPNQKGE